MNISTIIIYRSKNNSTKRIRWSVKKLDNDNATDAGNDRSMFVLTN